MKPVMVLIQIFEQIFVYLCSKARLLTLKKNFKMWYRHTVDFYSDLKGRTF
jgi:hypothetical protein